MDQDKRPAPVWWVRFLAGMGLIATWAFALSLAAWNLLRIYPGDRWLPVRLGNYFAPWLMILLSVGVLVAWVGKRRLLAGVLGVLCLILVVRFWPAFVSTPSQAGADSAVLSLRVMTFNVHYKNEDAQKISELIRSEGPDVVALQECTGFLANALREDLVQEYPYTLLDDGFQPRLVLLSRYPLFGEEPPPDAWRTQRAVIMTPAGSVLVWNVHAAGGFGQISWEWQRRIFESIAGTIRETSAPLVLMGDLNTTDQTQNYRLLADQLIDVQRAAGRGFGFTFPDRWLDEEPDLQLPFLFPLVRIDQVLVSHHWTPARIRVMPQGYGSDHHPVIADLWLTSVSQGSE